MFNFLNKLGLPAKYAILGAIGGIIVIFLSDLLGLPLIFSYIATVNVGAMGGLIVGLLRQRKGKKD